jgi:photosystem II stability/assembly factor-like uncharacterized protein
VTRRDEQRRVAATPAPAATAPTLDKTAVGPPPPAEASNEPKILAAPSPAPLAQAASNAVAAERIAAIASPSSDTRWRIVSPDRVERSLDGGATWTRTELPAGAQVTAGTSPAAGICWLAGRNGLVLRTIDGATWTPIAFPEPLALVSVRATSANAAVVTADSGASFETVDGGRTWVRQ